MGIRSSAANKLEKAFAGAFSTYFVGDPSFVKNGDSPMFVAAQSVSQLLFPQVCFMCLEAAEVVAQSCVYMGTLHIIVDTPLSERPDDYDSLLALHQDRVSKVMNLIGNPTLLKSLMNIPASGPDNRSVVNFQLYGVGQVLREMNSKEAARLSFICAVEIPFQPI